MNRAAKILICLSAGAALLVPALPASAEPQAGAAAEDLVRYLTKGKLKPSKRIAYRFVCSQDCSVTATNTLKLKGGKLGPTSTSGAFEAGVIIEAFVKPNKAARNAIKDDIGVAKLVTSVSASSTLTGETDTDKRTYKFKR